MLICDRCVQQKIPLPTANALSLNQYLAIKHFVTCHACKQLSLCTVIHEKFFNRKNNQSRKLAPEYKFPIEVN